MKSVLIKTTLLNFNRTFALVLVMSFFSVGSYAGGKKHGHHEDHSTEWAKVTHYEPITREVRRSYPERNCWYEDVEYYSESPRSRESYTGPILGSIIGGAIGNAVGHDKKNKQIGTAVGAILGASVGSDISSRHESRDSYSDSNTEYRSVKRCDVDHHVSYDEEIIGYKVWYRYHGETYQTRMDHKPGKRIPVRVSVRPM